MIKKIDGLELVEMGAGLASVRVIKSNCAKGLPWDRYVRLKASADAILQCGAESVLDVGGYDGALAFFLPGLKVDLVDPLTTGGSLLDLQVEDRSYDAVAAVDVLEHIEPESRSRALLEMARTARNDIVVNYPCRDSSEAQKLVLKLTGNALIREHVEWELPDSAALLLEFAALGFAGQVRPHASVAVWLNQYVITSRMPEVAEELNRHLIDNHAEEPFSRALYHLLSMRRMGQV